MTLTKEDQDKLAKLGPYQREVLRLLVEVPPGRVTTYGDLAKELARRNPRWSPKASRAVGTAMKLNPCAPRVPCHRVVRSDGSVGLFRGGEEGGSEAKAEMLRKEGVEVVGLKIDLNKYRHRFHT